MAKDKDGSLIRGNNDKGLAGEVALYQAFHHLAREFRTSQDPVLLGEPSPEIDDPIQIAEPQRPDPNNLPDVYWHVDDTEILAESKNIFYTWLPKPPSPRQRFYEMKYDQPSEVREGKRPPVVTAESIMEKQWKLSEYPIRGTSHPVRENGRLVRRYAMIPIMNTQSVTKLLVTSIPSIQDYAWKRLDSFFGGNIVFTQHPVITPFVRDRADQTCQDNTWATLVIRLKETIQPVLEGAR